ncbi:RWD domain-containing protein 1-like [Amphiura filiformis]|uniref:RWD domain-containing protein 1-like n=1 Tax=Amphiura filiformis TaxID=82378 RepID=UPI003B212FA1
MTDYKEEQENEVSALESIYPDEFTVLSTNPYHKFEITVSSESTGEEDEQDTLHVTLQFTYTDTYPDEAPVYEVTDTVNVQDDEIEPIMQLLQEQIEENLGMAMVFALVSALQEHLNERVDERKKELAKERELIEEEKRKKQEEADNILKGTPVTLDSFLEWKDKFDAERRLINSTKASDQSKKLTGRELFEKNEDLFTSDIALLEESDKVQVDESLFQDMDELDIDDEEFED